MPTLVPGLSAHKTLSGDYWPTPVLNSEQTFVGCVQWLDVPTAREAVALVELDDIADPATRLAYELVRDLLSHNVAPNAHAVLAYALQRDMVTGAHAIQQFTAQLWDMADSRVIVPASWRYWAMLTVDAAYRRRSSEMATRIQQASEHDDPGVLSHVLATEQNAVTALRLRHEAFRQEWDGDTANIPFGRSECSLGRADLVVVPAQRMAASA